LLASIRKLWPDSFWRGTGADQDGLGHHRTRAARTGEPDDGRQEMEKQDNHVAHAVIVNNLAKSTKR
jgi:hypothetical protein